VSDDWKRVFKEQYKTPGKNGTDSNERAQELHCSQIRANPGRNVLRNEARGMSEWHKRDEEREKIVATIDIGITGPGVDRKPAGKDGE